MELMTQEKEALKAMDFPVHMEPLFRKNGTQATSSAIVRDDKDEIVSVVSEHYQLMPYRETVLPVVEELMGQGWELATRVRGRSGVRVESNGKRVYVEMIHRGVKENLGVQQRGELDVLMPRMFVHNSYDRGSAASLLGGVYQLVCTNGLIAPGANLIGHTKNKHIGGDGFDAKRMISLAKEYLDNFPMLVGGYRRLVNSTPGIERSLQAIALTSKRKQDAIINKIEAPLYEATGWQVFSGITNFLTHEFKGAQYLFDGKQKLALDILAGEDK